MRYRDARRFLPHAAEVIKTWPERFVRTGMDQKTFCEWVGIPNSTFNQYLKFRRNPSIDRFYEIENGLIEAEKNARGAS